MFQAPRPKKAEPLNLRGWWPKVLLGAEAGWMDGSEYQKIAYSQVEGRVPDVDLQLEVELQRKLSAVARRLQTRKDGKEYALRIHVHPSILERLRSEDSELLVRVEKTYGVKLAFRADPNYHVENFKIINAMTNEEYR